MSAGSGGRAAFSHKTAEIAVAALLLLLGAIAIFDSARLGFAWGEDGPQPGYFPFYVALIICVSSLVNLVRALVAGPGKSKTFVEIGQLKLVLAVLVPTAIYAALIGWVGIYVASVLFVGFFMRWLGKYPWWKVLAVSAGNSVVFFLIFEIWFVIPLPKGPIEALLGLN
ncbi:MAG: tripartite tricarboxylate transporter TctB family protein [Betaproteobacteria bacterium]|nr:tripartite tricarboxylate transporter TctB family protein [Betaproteobacteria bacterium]MBI2961996.1 tripartite tricarboxylate transporter TctB family protein [Betaproteobacteria bacterium]